MKPIIHRVEQRSDEWYRLRSGRITASEYKHILAKNGTGDVRTKIIKRVAAEIITGQPIEAYANEFMKRGREQEPEALANYAMHARCDPELVGFIEYGRNGCSPDALIDKDGGAEIKTQKADLFIDTLFRDEVPGEHMAQLQGNMRDSGRKWWDLYIYCRGMPPFLKRVQRDNAYIKRLDAALDAAHVEIDNIVKRIRARM